MALTQVIIAKYTGDQSELGDEAISPGFYSILRNKLDDALNDGYQIVDAYDHGSNFRIYILWKPGDGIDPATFTSIMNKGL